MVATMTTFKVTERQNPHYGHEYPEYTKFARYHGGLNEWVPLLIAPNKVQSFALSNLTEIDAQPITQEAIDELYTELYERHTVTAVDMGIVFTVEQAPVQGCALPPNMTEYLYTCEPPPRELELVDYDMPWLPYTVADSQLQVAA